MNQPQASWMQSCGLVPLRAALGVVFLLHAWQKVFVFGVAGTADVLGKLGIPLATFSALLLIVVEGAGGVAILAGYFTRTAAALLVIEMCVAIPVARFEGGFFAPSGYEFEFTLLAACATLALVGPGRLSLEAWLRRESA
jgi:putative oxidoreductase